MRLKSYRELFVWQKSIQLTATVYRITEAYPRSEIYGLTSQSRRSAVSIASNIAEGSMRQHLQEYLQFLNIALGSAAELETQLVIGQELKFLPQADARQVNALLTEIMKMLNALIRTLKLKSNT